MIDFLFQSNPNRWVVTLLRSEVLFWFQHGQFKIGWLIKCFYWSLAICFSELSILIWYEYDLMKVTHFCLLPTFFSFRCLGCIAFVFLFFKCVNLISVFSASYNTLFKCHANIAKFQMPNELCCQVDVL